MELVLNLINKLNYEDNVIYAPFTLVADKLQDGQIQIIDTDIELPKYYIYNSYVKNEKEEIIKLGIDFSNKFLEINNYKYVTNESEVFNNENENE